MHSNELKAELKRHDMTYEDLAKMLGIAKVSVQRKINKEVEFTGAEIDKMYKHFGLSSERLIEIFFN